MSLIVFYFLHSTSVLSFYIDVVLTLSIWNCWMDFLISKFYAIAKTYSSGLLWSLAHLLHIGSPKKPVIQQSCWGVYWFHSVCPSVRPSTRPSVRPTSHVRFVAPTVLVGSFSYLYMLSSNFRRCVKCKVLLQNFFKNCNFVLFWLGVGRESLVWVIMGWRGVSQNAGILVVLVKSGTIKAHTLRTTSLTLLHGFSQFKALWNCLDLWLWNIMVICPFAPYGLSHVPHYLLMQNC